MLTVISSPETKTKTATTLITAERYKRSQLRCLGATNYCQRQQRVLQVNNNVA